MIRFVVNKINTSRQNNELTITSITETLYYIIIYRLVHTNEIDLKKRVIDDINVIRIYLACGTIGMN